MKIANLKKGYDLPQSNIAEITLIGTGGGYGESIVIHIGDDNWIIVDSCIDPYDKYPLPLTYLHALGVNVREKVKLVVCTHWHDDHIQGMSQVLSECESADFCMSRANDLEKFSLMISIDSNKFKYSPYQSSTTECARCIDIIRARKKRWIHATKDRQLYGFINGCSIFSLSPSDYSQENFDKEISSLIEEFGSPNTKIVTESPNSKSVVLFLKLGNHRAILGADMEVGTNPDAGWLDILNRRGVIDSQASLFKMPHHGSSNGYSSDLWVELLHRNPIAKLTPWSLGTKLPTYEMLQVFCSHTDSVYSTSPHVSKKGPKKRARQIEKFLKRINSNIHEVVYSPGIVRSRIDINQPNDTWVVDVFEKAFHVNPELK